SVDLALELRGLRVDRAELASDPLDGALDAVPLGVDRRRAAVAVHTRGRRRHDGPVRRRQGRLREAGRAPASVALLDLPRQLLEALLIEAELILELLAPLLELRALQVLLAARLVRPHLGLHLLDDHGRPPRALLLAPEDVAVDVIAHVEDAIAGDAK